MLLISLQDENVRATQINDRISRCQSQVNAVMGRAAKATIVHSTAKFPSPKRIRPPETLFSIKSTLLPPYPEADDNTDYKPSEPNKSGDICTH